MEGASGCNEKTTSLKVSDFVCCRNDMYYDLEKKENDRDRRVTMVVSGCKYVLLLDFTWKKQSKKRGYGLMGVIILLPKEG